MSGETRSEKGQVAALVGLSLLEVIRSRDLPTEILGAENPAETMPRRLGLTEAVGAQIRRFQAEARKGRRIPDEEAQALFQLVLRRPDAAEVFFQVGELLAGEGVPIRGLGRLYPRFALRALARRRFRKRTRALFGRSMGGFAPGPFKFEASSHFFLEMDSDGNACSLLSGFGTAILSRYLGSEVEVKHTACLARGQDLCRWSLVDGA